MLATYVVDSIADSIASDGMTTLREALASAASNPGTDTIQFASSLTATGPATITLAYDGADAGTLPDSLAINNVVIEGPGANLLSISGNNQTSVMTVNSGVTATIRGVRITGGAGSWGAGVSNSGNLTLENVEIEGNASTSFGGGIATGGTLTVIGSTIANNSAASSAGGIGITFGTVTIQNSTISGNSAGWNGGAIYNDFGTLSVVNSTITANRGTSGSGVANFSTGTLHNTIVAGNLTTSGAPTTSDIAGSFAGSSYNVIGYDSNLSNGLNHGTNGNQVGGQSGGAALNPQLSPLGYYGGSTKTHALFTNSPALDKGSDALIPTGITLDQRGFARNVDVGAAGPTGGTVDVGAFEFAFSGDLVVSTLADENDANYAAGDLSLREALALADLIPGANTITFDAALFAAGAATLTLSYDGVDAGTVLDSLAINSSVAIEGPGANLLSISGNNQNTVIAVNYGVTGTTIRGVRVTGGAAHSGAGISNGGQLTLDAVEVEGNTASFGGGGIINTGTLTVLNSTIANNTATNLAGGIYVLDGTAVIRNSTVSGNAAASGGGVYTDFGTTTVIGSTITANRANTGSGILSSATLHNTIVAGNLTSSGAPTTNDIVGLFSGSSYNVIGADSNLSNGLNHGTSGNQVGGQSGGAALNAQLAPLGDYGGSTKTHALFTTSPAIDKGSNAQIPAGITTDQRGFARIVDVGATGPTGGTVDVGAFEFAFGALVVSTLADENDANYAAGDLSLREALALADLMPGANTITFDTALFTGGPGTITLAYDGSDAGTVPDQLTAHNVAILGPGADKLIISGANQTRVFYGWNLTIEDLTVTQGSAAYGAGIFGGNITLRDTRVTGNTATSSVGGGIYTTGGLQVFSSEISDNTAALRGGGISVYRWSSNYLVKIENSTISGNNVTSPTGRGGGIYSSLYYDYGSRLDFTISSSTISGNRAFEGGGIFTNQNTVYTAPLPVEAFNTIIAGNTNIGGSASDVAGDNLSGDSANNLVGQGGSGGLLDGVDENIVLASNEKAGLSPLGYYGGTTRTHALLQSSPAIDSGDSNLAPAMAQNGLGRVDFLGEGREVAAAADIGAFETPNLGPLVVTTLADQNDADPTVGGLSLREALRLAMLGSGDDVITFEPGLQGTIYLTESLVVEDDGDDVTVIGPGADKITIDGGLTQATSTGFNLFNVKDRYSEPLREVTISGLRLKGGNHAISNIPALSSVSKLWVDNVEIVGNKVGISNSSILKVTNSTIADSFGLGIAANQGIVTIVDSTIKGNNSAGLSTTAGGINATFGTLTITGSTFTGNYGKVINLGVDAWGYISDTTFSGNFGTAVYGNFYSYGWLTNVTVAHNTLTTPTGTAIYASAGASITLTNSIVAKNTNTTGAADVGRLIDTYSGGVNVSYSLIGYAASNMYFDAGDNLVGTNPAAPIDPLLAPLGDYGGPTRTHALLPGSWAIDRGNDAAAPTIDQRGLARYKDPNSTTGTADIGAFEYRPDLVVSTLSDARSNSGEMSLRQALNVANITPGANTITFNPFLTASAPGQIVFAPGKGPLVISSDVVIDGPGADLLAIVATGTTGINVTGGSAVEIKGLHITGAAGAAISKSAGGVNLVLDGMKLTGNSTAQFAAPAIQFILEGSLAIRNSEISDNFKGGITITYAGLTLENSTIARNKGVGVNIGFGSATIVNSTISENETTSSSPGGLTVGMGGATIINSTIAYNRADSNNSSGASTAAGGINASDPSSITLHNSIVIGNVAGAVDFEVARDIRRVVGSYYSGSFHNSSSHNIIGADPNNAFPIVPGAGNLIGVPVHMVALAPLGYYGGRTRTHALLPGSLAIDMADDALAPQTDQRGLPRVDNPTVEGGIADVGAFELSRVVTTAVDAQHVPGELTLREAILQAFDGEIIQFAPHLDGATITLGVDSDLIIEKSLTIDASMLPNGITLRAYDPTPHEHNADGGRLFLINGNASTEVTLRGMTLTGGDAWLSGGAIRNLGASLTLENVAVVHNAAPRPAGWEILGYNGFIDYDVEENFKPICGEWQSGATGGGILSTGNLTILDSRFANNATSHPNAAGQQNQDQDYCSDQNNGSGVENGEIIAGDIHSFGDLTIDGTLFETEYVHRDSVDEAHEPVGVPDNDDSLAVGGVYATNQRTNPQVNVEISNTEFRATRGLLVDGVNRNEVWPSDSDTETAGINYEVRNVSGGTFEAIEVFRNSIGQISNEIPTAVADDNPATALATFATFSNTKYTKGKFTLTDSLIPGSYEIREVLGNGSASEWVRIDVIDVDENSVTLDPDDREMDSGEGFFLADAFGNVRNRNTVKLTNVSVVDPRWGMFLRFRESWNEDDTTNDQEIPQDLPRTGGEPTPFTLFINRRSLIRLYNVDAEIDELTMHQPPQQTAGGDSFGIGDGLHTSGSKVEITNSRFLGPADDTLKGSTGIGITMVVAYGSELSIRDSLFQNVQGENSGANSSLLELTTATKAEIVRTAFINNETSYGVVNVRGSYTYGAPNRFRGDLTISDSVFIGNRSLHQGPVSVIIRGQEPPQDEIPPCDPEDIACQEDPLPPEEQHHTVRNIEPYRVLIEGSTIEQNSRSYAGLAARYGGGGISLQGPIDAFITDSSISQNRNVNPVAETTDNPDRDFSYLGSRVGGGINAYQIRSLRIENSTISDNIATYEGGGIYAVDTDRVELTNVTVSGNHAGSQGGGVFIVGGYFPGSGQSSDFLPTDRETLTLVNTIIAGNTAGGRYFDTGPSSFEPYLDRDWVATDYQNTHDLWIAAPDPTTTSGHDFNAVNYNVLSAESSHNIIGVNPFNDTRWQGVLNDPDRLNPAPPILHGTNGNQVGVDPLLTPLGNYGGRSAVRALRQGTVNSPAIDAGLALPLIRPVYAVSSTWRDDESAAYNLISESDALTATSFDTSPLTVGMSPTDLDGAVWASHRPDPSDSNDPVFNGATLEFGLGKVREIDQLVLWGAGSQYDAKHLLISFSKDGGKSFGGEIAWHRPPGGTGILGAGEVLSLASSSRAIAGYVEADVVRIKVVAQAERAALGEIRFRAKPVADQRGGDYTRVVDIPGVGGSSAIDIGAYEAPIETYVSSSPNSLPAHVAAALIASPNPANPSHWLRPDTTSDHIDENFGTGQLSLREAIMLANLYGGHQLIELGDTLAGRTLTLSQGELLVTDGLTIRGTNGLVANNQFTIDVSGSYNPLPEVDDAASSFLPGRSDLFGNFNTHHRLIDASPTDGQLLRNAFGSRVLNIDNKQNSTFLVELDNIYLTGGLVQGWGGAIRNKENLELTNVVVEGNASHEIYYAAGRNNISEELYLYDLRYAVVEAAGLRGGGIYSDGGSLTIVDSRIENNSTNMAGGGIYVSGGPFVLENSIVSDNLVRRVRDNMYPSTPDYTSYRYVDERGGGIAIENVSRATIIGSTIADNKAISGDELYDKVTDFYSDEPIQRIVESYQDSFGGGIYLTGGRLDVAHSTISGNEAREGGGVYVGGKSDYYDEKLFAELHLTNSTVSGNEAKVHIHELNWLDSQATHGGGIAVKGDADLYVRHSTITENRVSADSSSSSGGGIYFPKGSSGAYNGILTITNTIIAGNPGYVGPTDLVASSDIHFVGDNVNRTVQYSLIGDNRDSTFAQTWLRDPALTSTLLDDSWEFGGRPRPDANGNIIGGSLIGTHQVYDPATGYSFHVYGGYADPLLDVLADNGGLTKTHGLLAGSKSPVALLQPASVQYVGTPISDDPSYPLAEIIDDPIAWDSYPSSYNPSYGIYAQSLPYLHNESSLLVPLKWGPDKSWRTQLPGSSGTEGTDYFSVGPNPVMQFNLGQLSKLTHFVTWSALFSYGLEQDNEAKELTLTFYEGTTLKGTYSVTRALPDWTNPGGPPPQVFALDQAYLADRVVVTVTDNYYGTTIPEPWETPAGDRVSMGQVRFIGELVNRFDPSLAINAGNPGFNPNADPDGSDPVTGGPLTNLKYDQRGEVLDPVGYDRRVNGRVDIGAFEARAMPGAHSAPQLTVISTVSSIPEDPIGTYRAGGIKVADVQVLFGLDLPYTFVLGGADADKFEMRKDAQGRELRELWLKDGVQLDFEQLSSLVVTVKAKDSSTGATFSNEVSKVVPITPLNDPPVLTDSELQLALSRDITSTTNVGVPISALLNGVADQDAGHVKGIAIVDVAAAALAKGKFQFSLNNGVTWLPVGTVSPTSALLLPAATNVRLRFNGEPAFDSIPAALTFRAWDQTQGQAYFKVDVNDLGTAVSQASDSIDVAVSPQVGQPVSVSGSSSGGNQTDATVAVDAFGNALHAWIDSGVLYTRRIAANGDVGNRIAVHGPAGILSSPSIALDTEGRYVVIWRDATAGIMGRRIDVDGNPMGSAFTVATGTVGSNVVVLKSDPAGMFVMWTAGGQLYARRYAVSGSQLSPVATAQALGSASQLISATTSSDGSIVSVFQNAGNTYLQRFARNGNALSSGFSAQNLGSVQLPVVATSFDALGNETIVVAWSDGASNAQVLYRSYRLSDFVPIDATPKIADQLDTGETLHGIDLASDIAGRVGLVWTTTTASANSSIHSRWFGPGVGHLGPFTQSVNSAWAGQLTTNVAGVFQYTATPSNGSDTDVYTQRYELSQDGTVRAEIANGVVTLDAVDPTATVIKLATGRHGSESYLAVNGILTTISSSQVEKIVLDAGDRTQGITIDLTALVASQLPELDFSNPNSPPVTVRGGSGNDQILIGSVPVAVDGGLGDDTYVVSDSFATNVVLSDSGGQDTLKLVNWQGSQTALLAVGYSGEQIINRGTGGQQVKLRFREGLEIENVIDDVIPTEPLVFKRSQKPASLEVRNAIDELDTDASGNDLSLREALMWAKTDPKSDVITFALGSGVRTINLGSRLTVDTGVVIAGPTNTDVVKIDGGNTTGLFHIKPNAGATIKNLTLTHGSATDGGAIFAEGDLNLFRVIIEANDAANAGGGIAFAGAKPDTRLQIYDSTIRANTADYGAGVSVTSGSVLIVGSTISGNGVASTAEQGGGLWQQGTSTVKVTNSTISSNKANTGGGVYNGSATSALQLTNVTIAANWAASGGGLYGNSNSILAYNTIIAGNTNLGTTPNDVGGANPFQTISANNLTGLGGSGNLTATSPVNYRNVNPALVFEYSAGRPWLKDNLGPTFTHALITGGSNSALNNSLVNQNITPFVDQRGYVPAGNRDIGAYELGGIVDTVDPEVPTVEGTIPEDADSGDVVFVGPNGRVEATPRWRIFTYQIVDGNHGNVFEIDVNSGQITVANPDRLDAESVSAYLLTVEATQSDNGVKAYGLVRISIGDVNEAPVITGPARFLVSEAAFTNDAVGTVNAFDPDGDDLTYQLVGGDGALSINASTGEISVADRTKLNGKEVLDVAVTVMEVASGGLRDTINVRVDVLPRVAPETPVVDEETSPASFSVSHKGQLVFNPLANLANYTGSDFSVTYSGNGNSLTVDYSSQSGASVPGGFKQLRLGKLSVNPDGTLRYVPENNLVTLNKLTTRGNDGSVYYSDETINYQITNAETGERINGQVVIRVTNHLPVFRSEYVALSNNRIVLDESIHVERDTSYRIDLADLLVDPDGDEVTIQGFISTNRLVDHGDWHNIAPGTTGNFRQEPGTGTTSIWAGIGYKLDDNGRASLVRKLFLETSDDKKSVSIFHDGEDVDSDPAKYRDLALSGSFTFIVDVSDGQKSAAGSKIGGQFEVSVAPWNKPNTSLDRTTRTPWLDSFEYREEFIRDSHQKIRPDKWSLTAGDLKPGREGTNLQPIGDTDVDLVNGTLQRRHELVLDGSGGASEYPLPGLVYDSSTADPRPIIEATLTPQLTGLSTAGFSVKARFTWYDHVNAIKDGLTPRPRALVTEVVYGAFTDVNDPWQFRFRPPERPIYSGVYHWELEFEITVPNTNELFDDEEKLFLRTSGDTAVVVQRAVTAASFKDGSPAKWNYTPLFGNGWALEGVPQLFIDDIRGVTALDEFSTTDDRLILWFPGIAPRVFTRGDITTDADRQTYGDGIFKSIDLRTGLEDPNEFGKLESVYEENTGNRSIRYTSADGIVYTFKPTTVGAGTSVDFGNAPAWKLSRIAVPGTNRPIEFVHDSGATKLAITMMDGTTRSFDDPSGNYDLRFKTPDNSDVLFETSGGNLSEIVHKVDLHGGSDRIRRFTYTGVQFNPLNPGITATDGRMQTDEWHGTGLQRKTTFNYNSVALLSEVLIGDSISYSFTPVATYALVTGLTPPSSTNFPEVEWTGSANQPLAVGDRSVTVKLNTNIGGANDDWRTKYTFDGDDNLTQLEEHFGTATLSASSRLSRETWTYDHLGGTKSYVDPLGRATYTTYDYNPPVGGSAGVQESDLAGNVVQVTSSVGTTRYEYETDNNQGAAHRKLKRIIDPSGLETVYSRNLFGQVTSIQVTGGSTSHTESWVYYDSTSSKGLVQTYTNALGLVAEYQYDSARRLEKVTKTDPGGGGISGESTHTVYVYDQNGYVDKVTVYVGISTSGNVVSYTDHDFDESGLLRSTTVKGSSGGPTLSSQSFTYESDGLIKSSTNGNGVTTSFTYDTRGLLTQQVVASGSQYTDAGGTLRQTAETTTYTYNTDGSLSTTRLPGLIEAERPVITTTYDPIARTETTTTSRVATSATIDAAGVVTPTLTQVSTVVVTYDDGGRVKSESNLLTGALTEYAYFDPRVDAPTRITEHVNLGVAKPSAAFTTSQLQTFVSYDNQGNVVYQRSPGQAGRAFAYDQFGNLVASLVLTELGAGYEYQHDAFGNVTRETEFRKTPGLQNPQQIITEYRYDQYGRLRRVIDTADEGGASSESKIDYTFEPSADLGGQTVRRVTDTSREGVLTSEFYDAAGRLVTEVNAHGGKTVYAYDGAGNLKTINEVSPNGPFGNRYTKFEYDALNRVRLTIQDGATEGGASITTKTDYYQPGQHADKWSVIATDSLGNKTKSRFDSVGNLIVTRQSGAVEAASDPITVMSYIYSAADKSYAVTTRLVTPQAGDETRVTRQVINTLGDTLISAVRTSGLETSDDASGPKLIAAGFEARQHLEYAAAGIVSATSDAQGNRTSYSYDNFVTGTGLVTSEFRPGGQLTQYVYDSAGNRVRTIQPRGKDDQGNQLPDNATTWTYDALGRVLSETTIVDAHGSDGIANGVRTVIREWKYDGLETTYTDRNGDDTVTEQILGAGGAITSTRTSAAFDGFSYVTTTHFNADGSAGLIVDSWSNGTRAGDGSSIRYTYDEFGRRRTTLTNNEAQTEFLTFDLPIAQLTTSYHSTGVRSGDLWEIGAGATDVLTNSYRIDKLNRIDGISQDILPSTIWTGAQADDKSLSITYNADSRSAKVERFAAVNYATPVSYTDYVYSDDGRLEELSHFRQSGVLIADYINTHDADGRLKTTGKKFFKGDNTKVLDDQVQFDYTASGQLRAVGPVNVDVDQLKPIKTEASGHDQSGNRLTVDATIGRDNRILDDANYVYAYDEEGRVTYRRDIHTGDRFHYTWDHRGKLLTAVKTNASGAIFHEVTYGYDALGRQIAKHSRVFNGAGGPLQSEQKLGYVYDGSSKVFEVDLTNGKINTNYVIGPGGDVVAVDQSGETIWAFADMSGAVRSVGSVNGSTWSIVHRNFDQYGLQVPFAQENGTTPNLLGDTSATYLGNSPILFASGEWDRLAEFYALGGRHYDPYSGRWVTDGGGENGYQFGSNNPARQRVVGDSGLSSEDLDEIYGNGFYRFIGETTRSFVGDAALAAASDFQLLAATTGVVTVGVLGGYAVGSLGVAGIAAGAKVAGVGVGTYLATQAGISAIETGIEVGATRLLGGEITAGGVATSFFSNFAINSVTGGIGGAASLAGKVGQYALRQSIEIGAGTAIDVARGNDALSSFGYNAAGSIGGEALFRGAARGLGAAGQAVSSRLAARRLASANAQLNILDNGPFLHRSAPICFVAGTPVLVDEFVAGLAGPTLDDSTTVDSAFDSWRAELLLPTAAAAIGLGGYWIGENRGRRKREKQAELVRAAVFDDWNEDELDDDLD